MDGSIRPSGPEQKLANVQAVELKTRAPPQAPTQVLRFSRRLQLPLFGAASSPPLSLLRGDTFPSPQT